MLAAAEIPFASHSPTPDEGWRLLDDAELQSLADPAFLIQGVIPEKGLTVVYGPSGCAKTTLTAGLDVALRRGGHWFGHPVQRTGSSLYVGAEDLAGWKIRLAAAKRAAGLPVEQAIGLYTFPEPIDLRDGAFIDGFVRFVRDTGRTFLNVTLDTFAAVTPGAAENNSDDMTAAMVNAQKIRDRLDVAVRLIHHTNAGGSRERGHSAMRGAADAMIAMTPVDDVIHIECSKLRNGAPFERITVKLVPVDGGGCALRLASDVLATTALTTIQEKVLAVLRESSRDGATKGEWEKACQDVNSRSFYRAAAVLEERLGLVQRVGTHFRVTDAGLLTNSPVRNPTVTDRR